MEGCSKWSEEKLFENVKVENGIVPSSIHHSPNIRPERLAKARKLSPIRKYTRLEWSKK